MSSHETIVRHDVVEPGSDRSFGLIVGGILAALGAYQYFAGNSLFPWFGGIGGLLIPFGLAMPKALHPLNIAWMRLGLLLGRIVTPVVMLLVYLVSIVPIGLLLRVSGKDLLRLKKKTEAGESYWIQRDPPGPTPESLKDQF